MYLLNNVKFHQDIQRTIGDTQYPPGWFRDPLERAKIGVVEVPDPVHPDPDMYITTENPDGSLTVIDRSIEERTQIAANKKNQIQSNIVQQTQERLDAFAQTRGYDSVLSACTYATSGIPKFATEGQYMVNMRDATWGKLYSIMESVKAGTTPMPTGFSDIEPLLPVLVWPI